MSNETGRVIPYVVLKVEKKTEKRAQERPDKEKSSSEAQDALDSAFIAAEYFLIDQSVKVDGKAVTIDGSSFTRTIVSSDPVKIDKGTMQLTGVQLQRRDLASTGKYVSEMSVVAEFPSVAKSDPLIETVCTLLRGAAGNLAELFINGKKVDKTKKIAEHAELLQFLTGKLIAAQIPKTPRPPRLSAR